MRRILALAFPLLLAFVFLSRGAEWWSEKWWFAALNQNATWWTYMKWRGGAFAVAAPLWLAIVGANMRLAWHQSLALREPLSLLGGPMKNIAIELSPGLRLGRVLAQSTVWSTAWLAALAAANRFDLWLLFAHSRGDASQLGFFLFRLPALEWFFGWLGAALALTFVACLTLYFWLEAIETGPGVLRASPSARRHLSLLGALLVAWKGADCALNVLGAPVVFGDSANGILGVPEQLAGLPTSQFFAWSALPVAALVYGLGTRDDGRRALMLSASWLCLALVLPSLAPSFARSLGVGDEAAQQRFVAAHLQATRRAWGFESVEEAAVAGNASFSETVLPAPGRRAPVALWPLDGARAALTKRLAQDGTPLRAARLHTAREGDELKLRAIVTRRELRGEAPARQLQAPVDTAGPMSWETDQTLDSTLLSESAPAPEPPANRLGPAPLAETEPFEALPRYRLTTQSRFAVERSSPGSCLILALRFLNFSLLRPGPPLMVHLDPVERAQNLAPFVNWSGALAHPVVAQSGVGPHVYWIVEGCFTARTYPNSATLPGGEGWGGVNYARQNVTAVFDGTTGESDLYLFNRAEPIARLWDRALPGLFRPIEEMPSELRAAIRPAPAQLNALSRVYARYHHEGGDETLNWASRASEWRPIFANAQAPSPFWSDALLPGADGALAHWQLSAFAPARGRVDSGESVATLSGIAGVTLGRDGSWQWRQWRPQQTLLLPNFATLPQITFNSEVGARFAPPTRVGVFPAFDEAGRADGFTAFRAQMQPSVNDKPAILTVQAATTGALTSGPLAPAPLATSLARARDLWLEILAARRNRDWPLVARLEAQLNRALDAPTATPTPTAAPSPTPLSALKTRATPTSGPKSAITAEPSPAPTSTAVANANGNANKSPRR